MAHTDNALRGEVEVLDLFSLEQVEENLFRAGTVLDEPFALYGGQVAAQALLAAGATVPPGRIPHSLHGYFLRGGDSSQPTLFRVDRDRDGRSYSARRVAAIQGGKPIFTMSASFAVPEDGPEHQVEPMPDAGAPDALPSFALPRLMSFEGRVDGKAYEVNGFVLPTRFWARCVAPVPDEPLLHAALLTYLSDVSTGLAPCYEPEHALNSSLDHAVWFHRPVRMDDWVLVDLVPHSVSRGRGWYTGAVYGADGSHVASLTQEMLFRETAR